MLWNLLQAPHWDAWNEYPQHMISWSNKKKYQRVKVQRSTLSRYVNIIYAVYVVHFTI